MSFNVLTNSNERWDAKSKVIGKANYTNDIPVRNTLFAKVYRSEFAHGKVTSIDVSEAEKLPGVVKVVTYKDVPKYKFPTAGHPYSLDPHHQDIEDRYCLTDEVKFYGDEIAAVIAEDELTAEKALKFIKITFDEYEAYTEAADAMKEGAVEIHPGTKNVLADTTLSQGDIAEGFKNSDFIYEKDYVTRPVHHAHMETQAAVAYKDETGRYTIISSTQIPHICRRILGTAFNEPMSNFRVIKPFIGGGFGNKQDVVIEPLVVFLSKSVGGRPVSYTMTREECFTSTRSRHGISYKMKAGFTKDGVIKTLEAYAIANNGAYASHGHSIAVKGGGILASLYGIENLYYNAKTIYTNVAVAGAMRGYGTPQVIFAIESLMDDVARELNIDPLEMRKKNFLEPGVKHPTSGLTMHTNAVKECLERGAKEFKYYEKLEEAKKHKSGDFRRGVGMAAFSYATGVHPHSLEIAGCRLVLNQDGRVRMFVGATEIGQGSDTVFRQMVAETVGIKYEDTIADSITDTDYSPFDTGAYASRQTFVTGMAVRKASEELKGKILAAYHKAYKTDPSLMDIVDGNIVYKANNHIISSLKDFALYTYYDKDNASVLAAEVSNNFHENNYPFGVTFCEVETDIKTGRVNILSMLNVHDTGVILNPLLAEGQVEGGMGMGVGYGLLEVLKYDAKGKPLNNNLLDYKMPTFMDMPHFDVSFVEEYDAAGPYGNKALGEPPLCSPAGAIRNAIYNAIDVPVFEIPINPQTLFENIKLKESVK